VVQSIRALGLAWESLVISDPKAELYHYTGELSSRSSTNCWRTWPTGAEAG
jgi:hypothetical protein